VLRGSKPTERDFMSKAALGEPLRLPHTAKRRRIYEGVSMYATLESARQRARKLESQPTHIAPAVIPLDGPVTFEQTGNDSQHFTVWGTPAELVVLVLSPIEVEPHTSDA